MSSQPSTETGRFSAALVRWFADLSHQGLFATDGDLRVIIWNRWMEIHSHRAAGEVVGRPLLALYPDLAARGLDQAYRDALEGRISVMSFGLHRHLLRLPPTNRDLGFDEMPQSARVGPLSDGDAVVGTVTTIEDISGRLAGEGELRKQIEIQRSARLAAERALRSKDEFLSVVSHEMRTPLNAVLGWSRILLDRQDVDADLLARALQVIHRNASAQARMIDDLLDVARLASGKLRLEMQLVEPAAVTLAAVDVISPSAKAKEIEIRTHLEAGAPPILGDPHRLQQVVSNLLSNAVKFTEPGGLVEIRVSPVGTGTRIQVSDTGHGISPAFLPFVFDRFRQSDSSSARRHGGLGLGLALVRELVELHGGTVAVDSPGEERGSTFVVDLPAASRQSPGRPSVGGSDLPSLAGLRVLVVEDEADARELLSEVLSRCGAIVVAASSCEEALAAIHGSPPDRLPNVLVSDLGMPEEDGYHLIRSLRRLRPEEGGRIPAVAVTGYANSDDRQRALAAGYRSHVAKPVDPRALVSAVADAARGEAGDVS